MVRPFIKTKIVVYEDKHYIAMEDVLNFLEQRISRAYEDGLEDSYSTTQEREKLILDYTNKNKY